MRTTRHGRGKRAGRRFAAAFAAAGVMVALGASQASAQTGCPATPPPGPTQYPDCEYPTPHNLGMFDKLQLGSYAFDAPDEAITKTYWTWPWRHVIWDIELNNDQGKFYLNSNAIRNGDDTAQTSNLVAFPWLGVAFQEAPTGGLVPDGAVAPWTGSGTQTVGPGNQIIWRTQQAGQPVNSAVITEGANSFDYSAPDGTHLTGTRSGNGTTWQLPWVEPNGNANGFLYNIEGYKVSGTWHGDPVTGHVVNEIMWSTAPYRATNPANTAWWIRNRIGSWSFFSTEYKDGTSESGQFLCGEYGFRGAIVTDQDGNSTVQTGDLNATTTDNGYLYELPNGEKFLFVDDPGPSSGTPFHFGQVYRKSDKNKVASSDAVGFTFGRQCAPQNLKDNR